MSISASTAVARHTPSMRSGGVSRASRRLILSVAACLASVALAACGGASHDGAIAQVGHYTISKALISQWMTPTAGGDFFAVFGREAPSGLVAEPADYPACVTALKTLTPIPGSESPVPQPTRGDLESRCRQLHDAVRYQTLTFLVNAYWNIDFAASHGISATSSEVHEELQRAKTTEYPAPGQLQNYLASRRRTLQQQLFELKLELLQEELLQKASTGGKQAALTLAAEAQSESDPASCSSGNIVAHCKGFKPPAEYPGRPPATQLEEIARWRPAPRTASPSTGTHHGPKISVG